MSIEAMKQALGDICGAKLCEINSMSSRYEMIRLQDCAIATLRQAIEQAELAKPEQNKPLRLSPMYEYGHIHDASQPEQEPQMIQIKDGHLSYIKKPWVGLHWDDMPEEYAGDRSFLQGAKWALAKLKEKNT
jgi:hypothetical protein